MRRCQEWGLRVWLTRWIWRILSCQVQISSRQVDTWDWIYHKKHLVWRCKSERVHHVRDEVMGTATLTRVHETHTVGPFFYTPVTKTQTHSFLSVMNNKSHYKLTSHPVQWTNLQTSQQLRPTRAKRGMNFFFSLPHPSPPLSICWLFTPSGENPEA